MANYRVISPQKSLDSLKTYDCKGIFLHLTEGNCKISQLLVNGCSICTNFTIESHFPRYSQVKWCKTIILLQTSVILPIF